MRLRGGLGRAALGIAISLVALALVARSVDLGAAWEALRHADARWLLLVVGFMTVDVFLRGLRWKVLLGPVARVPLRTTLASLLVGYLANNVLPARLGEIVRSHDLGARTSISRSTILGTIVIERVVDTVVVVAIAAVAILVLSVRGIVASAVMVGAAVTGLLVIAVAVAIAAHRLPGAERVAVLIEHRPRIRGALARLRTGLSIASDPKTMAGAVALSVGSWSCTVLAFAAAGQAIGLEPTIGQAALLAAGTNLATAIPAAPGYVGTFELAAVTIAASVGIGREPALAFAVLVHVAALAITSIGGAVVFGTTAHRRGLAGTRVMAVATMPSAEPAAEPGPAATPTTSPDA